MINQRFGFRHLKIEIKKKKKRIEVLLYSQVVTAAQLEFREGRRAVAK